MRFLHLSDLHIGLKLLGRDLQEDQEYILKQIVKIASEECPQAVVIAGDIYDKAVPSAEAVEVFDHFIADLTAALPEAEIMMISGNHDSAPRVNCFRSVLSRQKLHMIGLPPAGPGDRIEKVTLRDEYGNVNFYLLPFVKPSMVKQIVGVDEDGRNLSYNDTLRRLIEREEIDDRERNVLVSHQFYLPAGKTSDDIERMDSEIRTVGNIDQVSAEILERFDYAALGHIHKPMKVGGEYYRYSGTPLACSVSEAGQQKGMIMVELGGKGPESRTAGPGSAKHKAVGIGAEGTGDTEIRTAVLPLKPLRSVCVIKGALEEVLAEACTDYVTVILEDKKDLDVIDMQDRLRAAFPNLLEIRREAVRRPDYSREITEDTKLDPFELCCAFLKNPDQEEMELLRDVIHTVQGVN